MQLGKPRPREGRDAPLGLTPGPLPAGLGSLSTPVWGRGAETPTHTARSCPVAAGQGSLAGQRGLEVRPGSHLPVPGTGWGPPCWQDREAEGGGRAAPRVCLIYEVLCPQSHKNSPSHVSQKPQECVLKERWWLCSQGLCDRGAPTPLLTREAGDRANVSGGEGSQVALGEGTQWEECPSPPRERGSGRRWGTLPRAGSGSVQPQRSSAPVSGQKSPRKC